MDIKTFEMSSNEIKNLDLESKLLRFKSVFLVMLFCILYNPTIMILFERKNTHLLLLLYVFFINENSNYDRKLNLSV